MDSRLYVARLEVEGGLRNLVITINDKDNDCNLGWDTEGDADIWLQIGKLWTAAPDLLAACEAEAKADRHRRECAACIVLCRDCPDAAMLSGEAMTLRQAAIAKAEGE